MRGELVRVRSVRTIDGRPSRMPRVSSPAEGLTAPGWCVYTEPGPLLLALVWPVRVLCRLAARRRRSESVRVVSGRG
jgi:hypothetical protein